MKIFYETMFSLTNSQLQPIGQQELAMATDLAETNIAASIRWDGRFSKDGSITLLKPTFGAFFDNVNHGWLLKFLRQRIGDERVLCLIVRMLRAGIMEDGLVQPGEVGEWVSLQSTLARSRKTMCEGLPTGV